MKITKTGAAAYAIVLSALAGCASTTETTEPAQPTATPASQPAQPIAVSRSAPQGRTGPGPVTFTAEGRPVQRLVHYEYDRSEISAEYRPLIESHARFLRQNPQAKMAVQGHGDERGSREYNLALGQRRSEGVQKFLVLLGAKESQIEAVSYGEEKPVASGHDEPSWWQNRRSEMLYEKQ